MHPLYTHNEALNTLVAHLAATSMNVLDEDKAPSFDSCLSAIGALDNLRGKAAKEAEGILIAVACKSKYVFMRHAALNRLNKMLKAEMKMEPENRILATREICDAMRFIIEDDNPENYKNPEGKAVLTEIKPTHDLAGEVIWTALSSNPNIAVMAYWKIELEKDSHNPVSKEQARKDKALFIQEMKTRILKRIFEKIPAASPAPSVPPSAPVFSQSELLALPPASVVELLSEPIDNPPAPLVDPKPAVPVVDPTPEPKPVRPRAARPSQGDTSRVPGARWGKPAVLGSKTNTRPGTFGDIHFRR